MREKQDDMLDAVHPPLFMPSVRKRGIVCFMSCFAGLAILGTTLLMPTREQGQEVNVKANPVEVLSKVELIALGPVFIRERDEGNSIRLKPLTGRDVVVARVVDFARKGVIEADPAEYAFDYWIYVIIVPSILIALVISLIYWKYALKKTAHVSDV